MVFFLLRINPSAKQWREAVNLLRSVQGPISARPGCLDFGVFESAGDTPSVLHIEQWESLEAMRAHIQSQLFVKILAAMDVSETAPVVQFFEASKTWGMELVVQMRTPDAAIA